MKRRIFANVQRFLEYASNNENRNLLGFGTFLGGACFIVTSHNSKCSLEFAAQLTLSTLTPINGIDSCIILISRFGYHELNFISNNVDEIHHRPLAEKSIH